MPSHADNTLPLLPPRRANAHKGTFGSVAIIGGSAGSHLDERHESTMLGAPAFSAIGAIRSGCGLVKVATPAPLITAVLALAPFAIGQGLETDEEGHIIAAYAAPVIDELARSCSVIVAGMGMGNTHATGQIVVRLLNQGSTPVVLDADGINALCAMPDFAREIQSPCVLTPHPGEAARLLAALSIEADPAGDDEQRRQACTRLAQRLGCIVVLKGARTVISDGQQDWLCPISCPALAAAGSGDVLSGVIGSLIAQTQADIKDQNPASAEISLFHAACLAVRAHAQAGLAWQESAKASGGLIAAELGHHLPALIEAMRAR